MAIYTTTFRSHQYENANLHGYILGGECKLIAQNQALERGNRGKFSLKGQMRFIDPAVIRPELADYLRPVGVSKGKYSCGPGEAFGTRVGLPLTGRNRTFLPHIEAVSRAVA